MCGPVRYCRAVDANPLVKQILELAPDCRILSVDTTTVQVRFADKDSARRVLKAIKGRYTYLGANKIRFDTPQAPRRGEITSLGSGEIL